MNMPPQSRSGADKARDFWEEQACRFDDHYPLIASILRERGNQVWLAAECDRLTAENKALIAAASEITPHEDRALNLLRGLHKVVLDLAPHFEKPITDDNVTRWLALNSAQAAVKEFLDAANR